MARLSHPTPLIRMAALAALAALSAGGWSFAAETPASAAEVPASAADPAGLSLAQQPLFLQDAAEAETPRKPLMALLHAAGIGEGLEEAKIQIFGHVQGSYTYSFDNPEDNFVFGRTFDFEHDDPTLNQVDLTVERAVAVTPDEWDIGFRMEWVYGGDSRAMHSLGLFDHYGFFNVPVADDADSPDNQIDLHQLYIDLAIPVGNGLRLRAGKFVALHGYEVINPTGNFFFSHSYLFGYAVPFTHTGVLATYQVNEDFNFTLGFSRGWDVSLEDNNSKLDYLAQINWAIADNSSLVVSVVAGPEVDNDNWRTVVDVIYTLSPVEGLTFALNADYGQESDSDVLPEDAQWYGIAGYASVRLNEAITLNGRAEWFNDDDGARLSGGVGGANFFEATVGLQIRPFGDHAILSNLVFRPEIRYDSATEEVFDQGTEDDQFTAAIDAYFAF